MTKTQLRKKAGLMRREICANYNEALEKMIKSGCVDLPSEPDNYALVKDFVCAFCEVLASTSAQKKSRLNIQNIKRFI